MSLQQQLTQLFGLAFAASGLDASAGAVAVSQRPELADYQCNGALGAANAAQVNPRDHAEPGELLHCSPIGAGRSRPEIMVGQRRELGQHFACCRVFASSNSR